ncbi:MAG: hypothetical protein ACLTBV_25165 [Enterocloster bolteae]
MIQAVLRAETVETALACSTLSSVIGQNSGYRIKWRPVKKVDGLLKL